MFIEGQNFSCGSDPSGPPLVTTSKGSRIERLLKCHGKTLLDEISTRVRRDDLAQELFQELILELTASIDQLVDDSIFSLGHKRFFRDYGQGFSAGFDGIR